MKKALLVKVMARSIRRARSSPEGMSDFAAFLRAHAPGWLAASHAYRRLIVRRARQRKTPRWRRAGEYSLSRGHETGSTSDSIG